MPEFKQIRYERPAERVARITLARADIRNAQDRAMLYEINTALDIAMHDDEVRVAALARLVGDKGEAAVGKLEALAQPGSPLAQSARPLVEK